MSQSNSMKKLLISMSIKLDEKYDDSDDESDNDSSSGEVTRENVIDKVESYEGHTLDTDTYTYKEPETGDGKWGFHS